MAIREPFICYTPSYTFYFYNFITVVAHDGYHYQLPSEITRWHVLFKFSKREILWIEDWGIVQETTKSDG